MTTESELEIIPINPFRGGLLLNQPNKNQMESKHIPQHRDTAGWTPYDSNPFDPFDTICLT